MKGAKLSTRQVAKPWGRLGLPTPFVGKEAERIGEIWFEPPVEFDDLLAKYLFTSEKLSVQVHPSDNDDRAQCGKDECWLVLDAEPDARIALGFHKPLGKRAMRSAALDGSIEEELAWHSVGRGDFVFIPAGTVHAIGPGITLIEIQQNCDATYRLYDYGRPRDLHLDEAIEVALSLPHDPAFRKQVTFDGTDILVDAPSFRVGYCSGAPDADFAEQFSGSCLLVPLEGEAIIDGTQVRPGEVGWTPVLSQAEFAPNGSYLIANSP